MKNLALKTAWITTITPLVVGVSIFLLWVRIPYEFLQYAGLGIIPLGILSVCIGLHILGIDSWKHIKDPGIDPKLKKHTIAIIILVIINFITAIGCVWGAISLQSLYDLSVTNTGNETLHDVQVKVRSIPIYLGDISPKKTVHKYFMIQEEGTLILTATLNGKVIKEINCDYVTNGMRGQSKVEIDDMGNTKITENDYSPTLNHAH